MVKTILQYIKLIGAVVIAFILMATAGYIFAEKKSEPVYASKIDKLMYERSNKAPRYVITLPDKKETIKDKAPASAPEIKLEPNNIPKAKADKPPELTLNDILAEVPSIYTIAAKNATQKLDYINYKNSLTEAEGKMLLPKIGENGEKPWAVYGKSVEIEPKFKKVALVIKGMGFDETALDKLSKGLDSEIAFSFSPYAPKLGTKILPARQYGHETYMDLLLSSKDFLKSDSGPLSMSLTISSEESLQRLKKTLSSEAPIGGVIINDGIADESNQEILKQLLEELQQRGLLVIDATSADGIADIAIPGLARQKADVVIEDLLNRQLINNELAKAEKIAFNKGQVLLVVNPKPVIIVEVLKWIATFSPQLPYEQAKDRVIEKPLALVPPSNLVVE